MKTRITEKVINENFNTKERRNTQEFKNGKSTTSTEKPFSKVLEEVKAFNHNVNVIKKQLDKTEESEIVLLWQKQIHENYLKIRGGLQ